MTLKPGASTGDRPEPYEDSQRVPLLIEGELSAELGEERRRNSKKDH
jgi:hypothetical protein